MYKENCMLTPILDKEMKNLTSMKTGGVAKECYFPESEEELCQIIKTLKTENKKYISFPSPDNYPEYICVR